jgi:arylsulfatase A
MSTINRREFMKAGLSATTATAATAASFGMTSGSDTVQAQGKNGRKPNFVILFADDMGYGDWQRGGHPSIRTPNLNKMADQGVQMTQFYSGNPVCSPSRSALLTGRNSIRTGVVHVFFPGNGRGMSTDEVTIADALKPLGYTSACVGKWHLGSTYEYRPLRQGFDSYYGILYSNDMYNPDIFRDDERIEHPTDQTTLTKRYTEEAVKFIEKSQDDPFFLYVPYTMPHIPLFASDDFLDTSKRGLYGDVIEEIDWSVGQIMDTLDTLDLSENTLMMFTSDNGPWHIMNQNGGSKGLLRGAKGDTWEGGMREPFIARWPGRLPAGTISLGTGSVLDFFPTCVELAGGEVPYDRPYDGMNLMGVLENGEEPERTIFYYFEENLNAVRHGKWKLHFTYYDHSKGGYTVKKNFVTPGRPLLFDLESDPSELYDIADKNPEVVKHLTRIAADYKAEIERLGENRDLIDWFKNDWPTAPRKGE